MTQCCIAAYVYGAVQGVGFRYGTQQQAISLGLTGYVRNLDDGSVEVIASGPEEQVEQLTTWLKAGGPRSAGVDRVLIEPRSRVDTQGFSIRY